MRNREETQKMADEIKINNLKIPCNKRVVQLYREATQKEIVLYKMPKAIPLCKKVIYEISIDFYEKLPEIVKLEDKTFYKEEIKRPYQDTFSLIET